MVNNMSLLEGTVDSACGTVLSTKSTALTLGGVNCIADKVLTLLGGTLLFVYVFKVFFAEIAES